MYIFYDFETSSRELTGQILSYAFVITDQTFTPIDSLTGFIKLNRTQFPEVGAILTNKINVLTLQEEGDPEYLAAEKVYSFIASLIDTYTMHAYRVQFKSIRLKFFTNITNSIRF